MVALVLLPGLDGTGLLFADLIASLKEVRPVVVTYPTDKVLDYAELETLIHSYLPSEQSYFLLAESFSGPIAISIAASSPPGLKGVILCCSFARNPLPLFAPFRFVLDVIPTVPLPMTLLNYFLLGRFSTSALRAELRRTLTQVDPKVLGARARETLSADNSALLSSIHVPILYLRAREDRIVSRVASELVVSRAPQTKVIEFVAPHFLLQVRPTEAAAAILEFMGVQQGKP